MFLLRRQERNVVLVADVDALSVGTSIVRLNTEGPATVLTCNRMALPLEDRDEAHSAAAVTALLCECAEKVLKTYMDPTKGRAEPLRGGYCILKSPWTRFRTASAEEAFSTPKIITTDTIVTIAKTALHSNAPHPLDAILETGVMRVYLNGYPCGDPIGKRVTRAGVVAYESEVNVEMRRCATRAIEKLLPGREVSIRSSMCALLTILNEQVPDLHRFVILDVGSDTTDCAVVLKEAVSQSAVAHEGFVSILSRVAGEGLSDSVRTQLRLLMSESCSTDACKVLKDALARTEPALAKVFGEAFARLAQKRRLPNAALLSAPAEISPWLQSFFSRIDFAQFTTTLQPLSVQPLSDDHVRDVVTWEAGLVPDTSLGIAAGYVNILAHGA